MTAEMVQLFYVGAGGVNTRWRNPNGSWSAEQHLGEAPIAPIAAITAPGTGVLHLFYFGMDNSVYSRSRNGDGFWSEEERLGGAAESAITASVIPGTEVLQLFYSGPDGGVNTRRRSPIGSWSAEQNLGGRVSSKQIAALAIPGTKVLQLFYRGSDGGVSSRWRYPNGSWSEEQHLGGTVSGEITASVVPDTQLVQLFYRASDNTVSTIWGDPTVRWSKEQNLGGDAISDIAAARVPGTDVLRLFYVGSDHAVWSRWRNPDGSWSAEQRIGGQVTENGGIATVVVPSSDVLQLFYRGPGGACSRWRDPDGSWSAEQQLRGDVGSGIAAALVPFAVGGSLFVSVYGNQQHFTYRDACAELQDAWWDGGLWNLQQLSAGGPAISGEYVIPTTGPVPAAGSLFVSVHDDRQHFTYRDRNGNLQDACWDGSSWHLRQINDADAKGATASPDTFIAAHHTRGDNGQPVKATAPAVGGLFVSSYHNQHHFAYLDAGGGIQDVCYDGTSWHLQQINAGAGLTVPGA
ncbi:hypothetical protein, partial [uncultured Mycobacterium sp.]|uniref:hypothetical protein n=1 Tax=uncultured Mycobacterium sp. TaxID=171292 RepID=UPI0035CB220D